MYFPYLRGKQFELLALRELASSLGRDQKVLPIIEPVHRPDGSGLDRCIVELENEHLQFIVILNPTVGDLRSNGDISPSIAAYVNSNPARMSAWNLGLILEESTDTTALLANYSHEFTSAHPLTLIHKGKVQNLPDLPTLTRDLNRKFDVISGNLRKRHFTELLQTSQAVTLGDGFPMEERNSEYLERKGTVFCEEFLYLEEEKWFGFADYLTIGEAYSDGGFRPRAVVMHWTYQPNKQGPIWIRHFTSVSNQDTSNVGGKFLEAAGKLVKFLNEEDIHTQASEVIRTHFSNQTFPGLGILKKLSIQNHLELVSDILSRS